MPYARYSTTLLLLLHNYADSTSTWYSYSLTVPGMSCDRDLKIKNSLELSDSRLYLPFCINQSNIPIYTEYLYTDYCAVQTGVLMCTLPSP